MDLTLSMKARDSKNEARLDLGFSKSRKIKIVSLQVANFTIGLLDNVSLNKQTINSRMSWLNAPLEKEQYFFYQQGVLIPVLHFLIIIDTCVNL